jgi:hypothetical protein
VSAPLFDHATQVLRVRLGETLRSNNLHRSPPLRMTEL